MNTADRVKKVIVEHLAVDEADVKPETSIEDDLGADSLDKIDLCMKMELEFNRSIAEEEFVKLATVADITNYLEERIGTGVIA